MKNLILFFATITFTVSFVSAGEITFEQGTWAEIKTKAKKQNKLIFVDAYTTWCAPCKAMAKKTFTNDTVAKYFNSHFVNAKIDMEKGEGIELAKAYEVKCYPNLLFIDGDGKLIHRGAGFKETTDFIALAKQTEIPEATFSAQQNIYASGNPAPAVIHGYLESLASNCLPTDNAIQKYFSNIPESELLTRYHWELIRDYVTDIHSKPFAYLVNHRSNFVEKYTADTINNKIFSRYLDHANTLIRKEKATQEKIDEFKNEVMSITFPRSEELSLNIDFTFYQTKEKWDDFFNAGKELAEKYNSNNSNFLNNLSWQVYEKISDKPKLDMAVEWAKKSVELKEEGYNLDTYANLLYKTGNNELAIEKEKRAIEVAKAASLDTKDLEETLKRFQTGK